MSQSTDFDQDEKAAMDNNDTRNISAAILFMLSLLVINEIIIGYLVKLKERWPFLQYLQATTVTTLIGILSGVFLKVTDIIDIVGLIQSGFSEFFLIVLLPPILYESAINMEKESFFKNFGSILMFAIFGTIIATAVTSIFIYVVALTGLSDFNLTDSFAFGALISATDPVAVLSIFKECGVNKTLFTLIFGESILNDAVSILLYDSMVEQKLQDVSFSFTRAAQTFTTIFIGSMAIGFLIGLVCAYTLKNKGTSNEQATDNKETTILFVIPWVSYLIAEGFQLSGIVSIMFCGISMARYALPNVGENGIKVNNRFYHTLAYNCENLVFLFIGIGIVCFKLAWAFFMWFSGFRGAMAFALSMKSTEIFVEGSIGNIMLTITLLYAIINIFINASLLMPLIKKYNIIERLPEDQEPKVEEHHGFWNKLKDVISLFDQTCLKRLLLRQENLEEENKQEQIKKEGSIGSENITDNKAVDNQNKNFNQQITLKDNYDDAVRQEQLNIELKQKQGEINLEKNQNQLGDELKDQNIKLQLKENLITNQKAKELEIAYNQQQYEEDIEKN